MNDEQRAVAFVNQRKRAHGLRGRPIKRLPAVAPGRDPVMVALRKAGAPPGDAELAPASVQRFRRRKVGAS